MKPLNQMMFSYNHAVTGHRAVTALLLCLMGALMLLGIPFLPGQTSNFAAPATPQTATNMQILKQRIIDYRANAFTTLTWRNEPDKAELDKFLTTQKPDGSWDDINYADTTRVRDWEPWEHLMRLEALAASTKRPASPHYQSTRVTTAALKGLDFWFARKPICKDNYWHMAMGRNLSMKTIALLLDKHLTAAQKEAVLGELHYAVRDTDNDGVYEYHYYGIGIPATGQNKFWLAEIHLHAALLKNSPVEVEAAAAAMRSVIAVTTKEGINPDYSFLQHGAQLNSGAYGALFIQDAARSLALFHRLAPYEIEEDRVVILRSYFLQGLQWMIRRGSWDPLVTGRQIAKKRNTVLSPEMFRAVSDMKAGDPAFAKNYQAMLDHINGRNDGSLIGNKHFPRADYSAHRRATYSFHTRMTSERTIVAESGNGENLQNYYLSQGNNILLLDGDEYAEIFPVWRWDRIPGGTAPENNPVPGTKGWEVRGTRSFVGGVSDGMYGVSAKDLDWDNVTGKKSWFYFDDDIVCLGAGISSAKNLPISTTLNQTIKKSDVFVEFGDGSGEIAPLTPNTVLTNPKWIYQANVGYVLPNATSIELRNEAGITGDWHAINRGHYFAGTNETKDIFSLAIPHGQNPKSAKYAYILLPAQSKQFVQQYALKPQSRILSNTPAVQAVRNDLKKVAGIVFWKAGRISLSRELAISVDTPSILLVDQSGTNIKVSVSRYEQATVLVTLDYAARPDQVMRFELPSGQDSGNSVTSEIETHP